MILEATMDNQNHFGISTAHRLASEVGQDVLTSGGNAFDAAVASAVTLAVVEPGNSGVGGEGYCIFYNATAQRTGALCFMGEPCALATSENVYGKELLRGVLAPVVPGAAAGWFALISEKCTKSAEELFGSAINLAREGFLLDHAEADGLNWMADQFHTSAYEIFCRSDRPWKEGDRLRQPDLARTLEGLAREGPHFLYTGGMAESFDAFFEETGGLLRTRDLATYLVRWQETLAAEINDIEVHVPPPESTGFSVLFGLKLLDTVNIQNMTQGGLGAVNTVLNVLQKMDECVAELSSRFLPYDHRVLDEVDRLLGTGHIREISDDIMQGNSEDQVRHKGCCTTSLSVADHLGNLVCLTQTLDDGYGSGVVVPGTGILLNNGMAWFEADPTKNSLYSIVPGKHVFVPLAPTICLTASGQPLVALGTPGGYGIPQTTVQVLSHFLFFGDSIQNAISRPRIVTGGSGPTSWDDSGTKLEKRFPQKVYNGLGANSVQTDWGFGNFHAAQFLESGSVVAFADHRGRGAAYCA